MSTATPGSTAPTAAPTAVPVAAVDAYRRSGFVRGPRVLDEAQIDALQAEVLRVIEDCARTDRPQPVSCRNIRDDERPVWQIVNIWQASAAFQSLARSELRASWASALSGARELKLWHDQIQYKQASIGGETAWHQDSPYWPTLEPRDSMITAWIALDDAGPDNGCMSMVPGSQRWGDRSHALHRIVPSFTELPETLDGHEVHPVVCPVPPGCVHFHHPLTWHGSPDNHSGRPRRAIAVHYATERACYQAQADHLMKPFITAAPAAPLAGAPFITVWSA
jgi:phytanoyl-CoA hydroxylase